MIWVFFLLSVYNKSIHISHLQDIKICDGNRFQFITSYALAQEQALAKTIERINANLTILNVTYKDTLYRTYKIYNIKPVLQYRQSRQVAEIRGINIVKISGGTIHITYNFQWLKQQLGVPLIGNGSGSVTSDSIIFEKTLDLTENHQLIWNLSQSNGLNIQNSLTINSFEPYKATDYEIINEMLNKLKDNETTVKINLLKSLNQHYKEILKEEVQKDKTRQIPKVLDYTYTDYHGLFEVFYDNILLQFSLTQKGLSLLLSQSIQNYSKFQCGAKVPVQPNIKGGEQQFISHKLLESTLLYALQNGFLDVVLTQQTWQSRAFQFYTGDLHDSIPVTKQISSMQVLMSRCEAHNDKIFKFEKKDSSNFIVSVNFTCKLSFDKNKSSILTVNMPVNYTVSPILAETYLNFIIISVYGQPQFLQQLAYKIENIALAKFIVQQTLKTVIGSSILGSGYPMTYRRLPTLQIRDQYIFVYDGYQNQIQKKKIIQK